MEETLITICAFILLGLLFILFAGLCKLYWIVTKEIKKIAPVALIIIFIPVLLSSCEYQNANNKALEGILIKAKKNNLRLKYLVESLSHFNKATQWADSMYYNHCQGKLDSGPCKYFYSQYKLETDVSKRYDSLKAMVDEN